MAKAELIFQAITKLDHATAIREIMALADPTACLISVAFARSAGVSILESAVRAMKIKPRVYIGIRNDITSFQALRRLLGLGVDLYVVDTGSRRPLFHPKVYLVSNKTKARAIIGSANLTHYGLHNNIEASALLNLALDDQDDTSFVEGIFHSFEEMVKNHPKHVRSIRTSNQVQSLFDQGLVCDEQVVIAPSINRSAPVSGFAEIERMQLFWSNRAKPKTALVRATRLIKTPRSERLILQFVKVWSSKPLVARDLCVPAGKNTHFTGSMGFKQDSLSPFDVQTYFRNSVFSELLWTQAIKDARKEEAVASFELIVENLNYGMHTLKIAHDNRTETKSYKQRQFMTQLHWGEARPIIQRRDLIGRSLYLYKKATNPPAYLIEID